MVTLQQISDKLDECVVGGRCRVPKTGQTGCYDEDGDPIDCVGTGQDGEYQTGVSVDPRFTDNGDGTATDNLTGLTWLQDANCFGLRNWTSAVSDANTLADGSCGLRDESLPGEWRLSNVKEFLSLIDYSQWSTGPPVGHPFSGVQSGGYWSSTSGTLFPGHGWLVILGGGQVGLLPKTEIFHVWPVRDGPDPPTCVPTHQKEKGPRCSDGLDNDCDGMVDGEDPDCL